MRSSISFTAVFGSALALLLGASCASTPSLEPEPPPPHSAPCEAAFGSLPPRLPEGGFAADDARAALDVLVELGVEQVSSPRFDYSRLQVESGAAFRLALSDVSSFQRAVRAAGRAGLVIRPRGRGHSMNGHSLAHEGELELRSEKLAEMCRTSPDTVLVGSGPAIAHVDAYLEKYGLQLLVFNGGGLAPSVGGFISAGGYGTGSWDYGGFWNTVASVHIIDALGQLRVLRPGDDAFPYVFGSSGQLGYIVSAELRVRDRDQSSCEGECSLQPEARLEIGDCTLVPWLADEGHESYARLYFWWHFMLEDEEAQQAASDLEQIRERHQYQGFFWLPDIRELIPHKGLHAPLITENGGDVWATGIWVELPSADAVPALRAQILAVEDEVRALARERGYRRYLQVELTTGPDAWRLNLGDETYTQFQALKDCWDPEHIFGRGVVFPAP